MTDFYIGLITTGAVIGILEVFRFFDKRLMSAFILVGIPFIYIGFSLHDIPSLILCCMGVLVFITLAYFGYQNNYLFIVVGLVLHGVWDFVFPYVSSVVPVGYDIFCLTIDVLLAIYFYFRLRPERSLGKPQ